MKKKRIHVKDKTLREVYREIIRAKKGDNPELQFDKLPWSDYQHDARYYLASNICICLAHFLSIY